MKVFDKNCVVAGYLLDITVVSGGYLPTQAAQHQSDAAAPRCGACMNMYRLHCNALIQ